MSEVKFPQIFPNPDFSRPVLPTPSPSPPKDLTNKEWMKWKNNPGTAIYWLKDEEGNYEQMFVPQVIYGRCKAIGEELNTMSHWSLDSFRWVPESVEEALSLVKAQCGGPCTDDLDCVNNSCKCIDGFCRRK